MCPSEEWGDMSIRAVVSVGQHYKNPTHRVGLEKNQISASSHWILTCSRHDIAANIAELALNNSHSFTHSLIYLYRTKIVKMIEGGFEK